MDFEPIVPQLEFLAEARVTVSTEPMLVGPVLVGERRIVPITGGRFEGERLSGDVLPGGADWQIVCPDGTALLEARYTVRTDDGALIYVRNKAIRHGPRDVLERMATEPVHPSTYYFRTSPTFETGDSRYAWLNKVQAIAKGAVEPSRVVYEVYEVR